MVTIVPSFSKIPNRTTGRSTFVVDADTWASELNPFAVAINALAAELNTASASAADSASTAVAAAQSAANSLNSPLYAGSSTSSVAIGTGNKTWTASTGRNWNPGMLLRARNSDTNWMIGTVTAYNSTTGSLTLSVQQVFGSGTFTSWTFLPLPFWQGSAGSLGHRNRLINGDMRIDQRNAGAAVTASVAASLTHVLDRWGYLVSQAGKLSVQQLAGGNQPAAFTHSLLVTSLSAYTVAAAEQFSIAQNIEGVNFSDLGWGTANAQSVTLSFWVTASLTGTYSGVVKNAAASRSYPFTFTVSAANTPEFKVVVIPGDTSGVWEGATSNVGCRLHFSLGCGATVAAASGAWASGDYYAATGTTSVVGTSGATFQVTGAQLEAGALVTPFERRPYGIELTLCQRYFQSYGAMVALVSNSAAANANNHILPTPMRSAPTIVQTTGTGTGASWVSNGVSLSQSGVHSADAATSVLTLSAEL